MTVNRGKDFEKIIRECFEQVPNTSVDRLHDQMNGFAGSANICDFIVYSSPHIYYIECKSVHGNTLSFSNITKNQWQGMLEKSKIKGVIAGVLCWWVDKDVTKFIPIQFLQRAKEKGFVSIPLDYESKWILNDFKYRPFDLVGKKKRVFFEYDMTNFFAVSKLGYAMDNGEDDIPRRSGIWPK